MKESIDQATGAIRLTIDIEAVDFDVLVEDYGLDEYDDLEFDLKDYGYYLIRDAGRRWLRLDDWKAFVRDSLRRLDELSRQASRSAFVPEVESTYESAWNERRTKLLDRNKGLEELIKTFVQQVEAREPAVRLKQNAQTITFLSRKGERAGLRLRAGRGDSGPRLWIVGTRSGEKRQVSVRTAADFDAAIAFIAGNAPGEPMTEASDAG